MPSGASNDHREEVRSLQAPCTSPLVWGPGLLGVLPCTAAGTHQNPGSPWLSAHRHGNSLAAAHWVACSIYFYGTYHHGTYLL